MKTLMVRRQELAAKREAFKSYLAGLKDDHGNVRDASNEAMTAMEAEVAKYTGEIKSLEADVERLERLEAAELANDAALKAYGQVQRVQPLETSPANGGSHRSGLPDGVRIRSRVTSFKSDENGSKELKAYRFGQFLRATIRRDPRALRYCAEHGIELQFVDDAGQNIRAATEGINVDGGFLVPEEFDNDLIDLREKYGVFRQFARNRTMTRDTKRIPRRTGGLTAYFVGENTAVTESQKGWDQVNLTAKKLMVLTKYSSELDEDSIIDMGNDLAREIAYAFALKEDQSGFNGDGSSTYGGMVGVRTAFTALSGTIANIAGLVVGAGNAYSELTLANFTDLVGRLPQYAAERDPRWFVHRQFYWSVMVPKLLAEGGVTLAEISRMGDQLPFLGYPVTFSQVMPSADANSQVCALFGSLDLSSSFGDRRETTIASSTHLNFAEDEIAIRGTERFDIVNHDVGNASATAALRVPGPIVGLITAAS